MKIQSRLISAILIVAMSLSSLPTYAVFASEQSIAAEEVMQGDVSGQSFTDVSEQGFSGDAESDGLAKSSRSDAESAVEGSFEKDDDGISASIDISELGDSEMEAGSDNLENESSLPAEVGAVSEESNGNQAVDNSSIAQEDLANDEPSVGTNAVIQASKSSQDPPYVGAATTFATGPANPRQPKTYYLDLNETGYPTAVSWEHYGDYMQGVGILYPGDKLVIIPEVDPRPGLDGSHGLPGKVLVKNGEWQDLVVGDRLGPLLISGSVTLGAAVVHSYVTEITVVDCPVLFNYSGSGNSGTSGWAVQYEADYPDHGASYWSGGTMVWVALPNYHPIEYTFGNYTTYTYETGKINEVLDENVVAEFARQNPSVLFAEDLSCTYNPIDGRSTVGPEFTLHHPAVLKGYMLKSVYAETNTEADRNYEPTKVSESEDGSTSAWRFFFNGANDYNWSFDNQKHGSEEDPIKIHIDYYEAKTVTLHANGGLVDNQVEPVYAVKSRSSRKNDFGWVRDRFYLSEHVPVRDGYVFTGWYADANCTDLISAAGSGSMYNDFNTYLEDHNVLKKADETNCAENFDIYAGWGDPKKTSIGQATFSNLVEKTYTGSPLTQNPTVKVNGKTLKKGTDYALTFRDNIDAGTATIFVTGKGNYWGVTSTTFKINPMPLTPVITLSQTEFVYDGEYHRPDYTVTTAEGVALNGSTDYSATAYFQRDAGESEVVVRLRKNYTGTATAKFKVLPLAVSSFDAELAVTAYTYDGTEKKPLPKPITINGNSASYDITYKNNVNAGTAKAVITLKGNHTGSKTLSFTIKKKTSKWSVAVNSEGYSLVYDHGWELTPPCVVKANGTEISKENYIVTYKNNTNAGTATVNVDGINDRAGWYGSANFTIQPLDITTSRVSDVSDQYWTGKPVTPRLVVWLPGVYYGTYVTDAPNDFEVTYANNINVGDAMATIKGKGNFKGMLTVPFKIIENPDAPALTDISKANVAGVSLSYGYSGKAYTPVVTVTVDGKTLSPDTDYTVKYTNNTKPGTAKITITGKGDYTGTRVKTFEIVDCVSSLVSGKTYQLIPKNNSKTAVCSYSGKMINNTKVYITDRSSSEAMKFKAMKNSDGTWKFINAKCELTLAVQQNSLEAGKGLVLYDQTAKTAQNWKLSKKSDNSFAIINAASKLSIAMSDASAVKGTTLSMAVSASSGLQRFYIAETDAVSTPFDGTYAVRASKDKTFALNIASSSKAEGANVNLYKYSNVNAKKFKVIYSGSGYYRLVNVNSGLVLTVKGNTKADGTNVVQSKWNADSGQRWKIVKNSNGTVTLTNALGTVLHLNGNKTADGTNVVAKNASTSGAQKWYLQ
ncbi:MAG: RICIN domain-containing protein [Lachnospiraceae bacterium]|nr:RICIN domain-containing protein [Lachnospiraceae bacterium]